MLVPTKLGDHPSGWRFHGSTELERWLDELPWKHDGGVRVIRIRSAALSVRVVESLRMAVHGRNCARSNLLFSVIHATCRAELWNEIERALQARTLSNDFDRLREISERLSERPCVFVVQKLEGECLEIVEAAQELFDLLGKIGTAVALSLVVLTTRNPGVRAGVHDYTIGWPIDCNTAGIMGSEAEAWRSYVHERLAWESGGDLCLAEQWHEELHRNGLKTGDDQFLESLLNQQANYRWAQLDSRIRREFESRFAETLNYKSAAESESWCLDSWDQAGMAWMPPGRTAMEPTPWFSRSWLLRKAPSQLKPILRNSLICKSLGTQILRSCFDLEAQELARCLPYLPQEYSADSKIRERYSEFLDNSPYSEAVFYPRDCPARPDNLWQFAAYGEILNNYHPPSRHWDKAFQHRFRVLRNSLSHGHYVSWAMLLRLREVQLSLGY